MCVSMNFDNNESYTALFISAEGKIYNDMFCHHCISYNHMRFLDDKIVDLSYHGFNQYAMFFTGKTMCPL